MTSTAHMQPKVATSGGLEASLANAISKKGKGSTGQRTVFAAVVSRTHRLWHLDRSADGALARNLPVLALALIMVMAFSIRLYSVVRFESVIHEFDPWFNFRATQYLVEHGPMQFFRWFDNTVWHPMGRHVGRTVYPGMIFAAGFAHYVLNRILCFPVELRNICVFTGPVFSALTCVAAYFITQEILPARFHRHVSKLAGLLAASFVATVPGYISRSVAGSFDYEAIAITQMLTTFCLWLVSVRKRSALWAIVTAGSYFTMAASWGGYVFVINLIPLHTVALAILRPELTTALYKCYCSFYVVALLSAMTVPFVSHQPIDTSEHMLAMGTFALLQVLQLVATIRRLQLSKSAEQSLLRFSIAAVALVGLLAVWKTGGKVVPWAGRFYSLWDTSYARKHIPIIASVSEHQPTTWGTLFMDMQLLFVLFPAGLYTVLRHDWLSEGAVFAGLYALSATYFASVMVRLILTLAPLVCICAGIAVAKLLDAVSRSASSQNGASQWGLRALQVPLFGVLAMFLWHCVYVTHSAYSSPSIMLSSWDPRSQSFTVIDDFREAYGWLRHNTPTDAKVLAWWDYGYQLNGMANRTTIVDNNTWNNEHIALVGKIFASPEEKAMGLCQKLGVDYVLVLFGGLVGFSGDDLNKFLWMIRIAQGVFPDDVKETDFYNAAGEYRMDDLGSDALKSSLMYRLSYGNLGELLGPKAIDRARRAPVSQSAISKPLRHFREVFSSENFLVRIYQVVRP